MRLTNMAHLSFDLNCQIIRFAFSFTYQFNSYLFVGADICAVIDVSKGSAAKFSRKSVLSTNSKFHFHFGILSIDSVI